MKNNKFYTWLREMKCQQQTYSSNVFKAMVRSNWKKMAKFDDARLVSQR